MASRQSPRPFKSRPSAWDRTISSQFFRIEEVKPARSSEQPYCRMQHTRTSNTREASDNAFGDKLMTKGVHRFVLSFELAHSSSGFGIILGVATPDGRQKVGVRVWDGRAVMMPQQPKQRSGEVLASPTQRAERAVSSRIEVLVDMFRKSLAFSIDGGAAVDSGILPEHMPESLVVWACIFFKGDAVTLSHHRHRACLGSPPSPPAPVRVPSSNRSGADESYEAGPWIT